jgi:hypothetical protein
VLAAGSLLISYKGGVIMGDEQKEQLTGALSEGYTAGQAAEILSRKSGRPVKPDYVRKLAQKGVIRSIPINQRLSLYNKEDVDVYIVEERGKKAGRAARARARSDDSSSEQAA